LTENTAKHLIAAGKIHLLSQRFASVSLPKSVQDELRTGVSAKAWADNPPATILVRTVDTLDQGVVSMLKIPVRDILPIYYGQTEREVEKSKSLAELAERERVAKELRQKEEALAAPSGDGPCGVVSWCDASVGSASAS
jgi:hypothetical protein